MAASRLSRSELADFSNIAGFGLGLAGTIWGAVELIHQHISEWAWPLQAGVYLGVFLALSVFIAGGLKEASRLYRWLTRGTREPEAVAALRDEALERRVEAVESDAAGELSRLLNQLTGDEVAQLRRDAENLTGELRHVRRENENLRNNVNLTEEQSKKHAQEASAMRAEKDAAEARVNDIAEKAAGEIVAAQNALSAIEGERDAQKPILEWATSLMKQDSNPASRIEIVSSTCNTQYALADMRACLIVAVRLRSFGVFPIVVGEQVTGGFLFKQTRFTVEPPDATPVRMDRGNEQTVRLVQLLSSDKQAVAEHVTMHDEIELEGDNVALSVTTTLPDGTPVKGWLTLPVAIKGKVHQA